MGAAGFIASHVANRLVRSYPDDKIVVLDKLDYCSNLKNLNPSRTAPNFNFARGILELLILSLQSDWTDQKVHPCKHTDEVYGERDGDAVLGNHEASQLLPTNPYSATKPKRRFLLWLMHGRP
ncbi:hypothetical protein POM88_015883 [Heracleum sosnowskyi]|uniref:Uncharacterized protein n=1 Tax=Heracleum sosnowskyi TaxID=360622 RepID=A0AAD8MSG2_9APIA|nr:hypothetical protein POM88_015883 [Heracleum sosnowskyi]